MGKQQPGKSSCPGTAAHVGRLGLPVESGAETNTWERTNQKVAAAVTLKVDHFEKLR